MILVTGSTGNLGRIIINQLSKNLNFTEFAALARNPLKAKDVLSKEITVRIGDLDDPESLENAFEGVDKLVLISTMETHRFQQHKNAIDAAKKVGVKHIYYTGLAIKDINTSAVKDLMISHFQTEDYIIESGLKYTFLRNTMYAEALPQILGHLIEDNILKVPFGNGKVPFALRDELGEGIANLVTADQQGNKIYNLTGSNSYNLIEVVEAINNKNQTNLIYEDISEESYVKKLNELGFPEFVIYLHHATLADIRNEQYDFTTETLALALGRKSASIQEIINKIF